jgi:hypothetical protein
MMARNARVINDNAILVVAPDSDDILAERHGLRALDDQKGIFGNRMIPIFRLYSPIRVLF